jgi:hypothetical protein
MKGQDISADNYAEQAAQEAPQTWDKCSIEQKIERLRVEILNARHSTRYQYERFARIENQLQRLDTHQHSSTGEVLISLRNAESVYGLAGAAQCSGSIVDPLA